MIYWTRIYKNGLKWNIINKNWQEWKEWTKMDKNGHRYTKVYKKCLYLTVIDYHWQKLTGNDKITPLFCCTLPPYFS